MSRTAGKTVKKKNNISSRFGMFIVIGCLVLLAVVVAYKANDLKNQSDSLTVQASELQTKLDEAKQEYKDLEKKEEYMKTDEYVEDVARSQLGLVYPDEIVIKPEE